LNLIIGDVVADAIAQILSTSVEVQILLASNIDS
jgi:hypothetical protein